MPRVWPNLLIRHLILLIIATVIGALYGQALAGALIATLAILAWHLLNLYRLERWLATGRHVPYVGGNGVWPRIFARINFINERSRANRKQWRKLVKELRASAKAFPDGGVILDANREIVTYNKAARQLLGLKKKRDKGQRIDNLIRHPDFVSYLESDHAKRGVDIPAPGGRDAWLSCRIIPYGPDQSLLLVRDITQTVMMEKMRRDFVANASHELRSPLTVIAGYLDSLAEGPTLPPAWKNPVDDMREQTNRMSALVRDLLQLSRLEMSESCSKTKEVDMGAVLSVARKDAMSFEHHPRTVDIRLDSEARLLGEEQEIQSIVNNLVSNAVRYTSEDGAVTITWETDERGGCLSVTDTGIGISADDIPRLTERFYRTDSGRARQKSGTGLGLAIVKHALKRHDAQLEIQSRLGEGSTFACHFPADRLVVS